MQYVLDKDVLHVLNNINICGVSNAFLETDVCFSKRRATRKKSFFLHY